MKEVRVIALANFPLIKLGDEVAELIVESARRNGLQIEDGDVIAIAQKVFSKAENRIIRLRDVISSRKAEEIAAITGKDSRFVEMVLRETKKIVKVSPEILIVEDNRGLVVINAGVDKSNVAGSDDFALLPENPDVSAERCRLEIRKLTGRDVGVVICDTYSRPFRRGQVNFAIGLAGVKPFRDYRGKEDLFGYVLKVKNVAVVDEIAAAAELLMGQAKEATPVVIFKGLNGVVEFSAESSIEGLYISAEEDLFRNAL